MSPESSARWKPIDELLNAAESKDLDPISRRLLNSEPPHRRGQPAPPPPAATPKPKPAPAPKPARESFSDPRHRARHDERDIPIAVDMRRDWNGFRLRSARIDAGVTESGLAAMLGVTMQAVSAWEHGQWKPKSRYLNPLALFILTVESMTGERAS